MKQIIRGLCVWSVILVALADRPPLDGCGIERVSVPSHMVAPLDIPSLPPAPPTSLNVSPIDTPEGSQTSSLVQSLSSSKCPTGMNTGVNTERHTPEPSSN